MKISVNPTVCCGAGMCVVTAPELFDQNDTDGTVILLRQPDHSETAVAFQARDTCPSGAIEVMNE